MKSLKLNMLAAAIILSFTSTAQAIPTLQLFLEGGYYNSTSESWTVSTPGTFKLWVLGQGGVYDVKLAAAYKTAETGTISLTPTTASASYLPSSMYDTTTPELPAFNGFKADGTIPVMGDGAQLPNHGTYGPGTRWAEWYLGDFIATSDKVADMTASTLNWKNGQLNAYNVTITGFTTVDFDAYDHVVLNKNKTQYVKAPFSHDAEAMLIPDTTPVPEPSTFILLGAGLAGVGFLRRRVRK